MAKTTEQKIQELELQTVRAVTELQKDVQALTTEVTRLTEQIQKMTENYVTKVDHLEDMTNLKVELVAAKRAGFVRTLLVALLMVVITAMATNEIGRFLR